MRVRKLFIPLFLVLIFGATFGWAILPTRFLSCRGALGERIVLGWAKNIQLPKAYRRPESIQDLFSLKEGIYSLQDDEAFSVALYGHASWVQKNVAFVMRPTGLLPEDLANDRGRVLDPQEYAFENGFVTYDAALREKLYLAGREDDVLVFLKRFKSLILDSFDEVGASYYPSYRVEEFDLRDPRGRRRLNATLRNVVMP